MVTIGVESLSGISTAIKKLNITNWLNNSIDPYKNYQEFINAIESMKNNQNTSIGGYKFSTLGKGLSQIIEPKKSSWRKL
jgi:hypothetical protein